MKTHLILVSHAITDWNVSGRIQGHTDTPLNDTGREMARRLGGYLKNEGVDKIYTSDLRRAYETAEPLCDIVPLTIIRDMRLREGRSVHQEVSRHYPMLPFPVAFETEEEVCKRMVASLTEISENNRGKKILIVSHGGAVEIFITHILQTGGRDPRLYEGKRMALNHIYYDHHRFECGELNETKDYIHDYQC